MNGLRRNDDDKRDEAGILKKLKTNNEKLKGKQRIEIKKPLQYREEAAIRNQSHEKLKAVEGGFEPPRGS
jgi:putative ubiquitin-RnfH superfamily antitoxin RatB of RatAB toxin-antitoxin module